MSQTPSNCSTRLKISRSTSLKTCDFQAFYKLIRHLVNLSKNLQAFLCLLKLSQDISDAPSCFGSVSKVPTYLANFSKDSQRSYENSENSQVTPEHPRIPSNFPRTSRSPRSGKEGCSWRSRGFHLSIAIEERYDCWRPCQDVVDDDVRCSIAYTKRGGTISVLRGGEDVATLDRRKLTARRSAPVAATPCVATSGVPSARGDLSHARTRRAYSGAGQSGAERNGAARRDAPRRMLRGQSCGRWDDAEEAAKDTRNSCSSILKFEGARIWRVLRCEDARISWTNLKIPRSWWDSLARRVSLARRGFPRDPQ